MMFFLLTFADLFSFSIALLTQFGFFDSWRIGLACAIYLITKAYIFSGSFLSIADGVVGVYIILLLIGIKFWFIYLVLGLFVYKVISLIT